MSKTLCEGDKKLNGAYLYSPTAEKTVKLNKYVIKGKTSGKNLFRVAIPIATEKDAKRPPYTKSTNKYKNVYIKGCEKYSELHIELVKIGAVPVAACG